MKTHSTPITESTELQKTTKVIQEESNTPILWQNVLVGGIPGILIGAGVSNAIAKQPEDVIEESNEAGGDNTNASVQEAPAVLVAHSVSDEMSFSEAFAAARREVGPGGAFVWHGKVYGTYRGDDAEWQEMSAEDRAEHSRTIISQVRPGPYTPTANEPEIVEVSDDEYQNEIPAAGEDEEVDIHIVGVAQGQTEDGTIVSVGYGAVDGQYAEFIDSDGDGEVDTVLIDANDNHVLDEGEVHPVSGITVDDLVAEAQANTAAAVDDALYGDMPDYTNDADTSSFV